MYHKGRGVPKDAKTAVKWYRLAAKQGHGDAKRSLDLLNRLEKKKQLAAAGKMIQARCLFDKKHTIVVNFDSAGGKQDLPELGIPENSEVIFLKNEIVVKFNDGSKKATLSFNLKNGKVLFNEKDGGGTCTYSNLSLLKNKSSQGASLREKKTGTYKDGKKEIRAVEKKEDTKKSTENRAAAKRESDYQKGRDAYYKGDYATALRVFKPLAERGHTQAATKLGIMYTFRQGVPQDAKEASKWNKIAGTHDAVQQWVRGNVEANAYYKAKNKIQSAANKRATQYRWNVYNSERIIELGKAVDAYWKDDYATALRVFKSMEKKGDAQAQYMLGQMYERGEGVPNKDNKTALKWYRLSGEQGFPMAKRALNRLRRIWK